MRDSRVGLSDTLWLAILGAMVAGAAHVGWVSVRMYGLGLFTWTSRELPWFSPLAYLACLLVFALPLILLARLAPRLASWRVQGTVFGGLTSFAILLHFTKLHPLAEVALALGLGVQAGRYLAREPERRMRVTRRVATVLGLAHFLAGIPEIVVYRWQLARGVVSVPAARPGAANVVLLILDTVRAANLGVYGYGRPTSPVLDRLAAEATVFEAAMAPAGWTAPTHATILTGRYPVATGITFRTPMHDSVTTVTERFRAAGYATGAFMGNVGYAGRQTGFDRGFGRYDDYEASFEQLMWSATLTQTDLVQRVVDGARNREWWRVREALTRPNLRLIGVRRGDGSTADEIADHFIAWRDGIGERPYFVMLNMFDAHEPYDSPFRERFNGGRTEFDRYDGAIAYQDSIIGSLVSRLRERGDLDRTIFVVLADHGEHFGEHGLKRHGNSLYLELIRVPLLIRAPGLAPAGLRIPRVVSLRDIAATLLDLANVDAGTIPGSSLANAWGDSTLAGRLSPAVLETERSVNQPRFFPTFHGPMRGLVGDGLHYIRRGDGEERVYAWRGDTTGIGDQTASEPGRRFLEESRSLLARHLGAIRVPSRLR